MATSSRGEQVIYTWQHQRDECCHTAGSLAFGLDGSLYISTGDNSNPFESSGFTPIDERPGREAWDAQRTAANSNDPNGKILRILPLPGASGTPGIGTTYAIPPGNMFDEAQDTTNQTLPEIYAMGFRNPFRITSIRRRAGCCSATTARTRARPWRTAARRAASSSTWSTSRASMAGPTASATTSRTTTSPSRAARPAPSLTARTL